MMKKNFGPNSFMFPMPVLIISAYDEDGTPCCMNAAWGGICGQSRISMCLSPGHKTVKNIMLKKAFTVSMGDVDNEVACDYVGIASGNNVTDKFAKAGFHATKSEYVDAPLIDELSMALECRLISYDESSHTMIGDIVNVCADESVLSADGKIDPAKIKPITYDPVNHKYIALGQVVGDAFSDGNKIK